MLTNYIKPMYKTHRLIWAIGNYPRSTNNLEEQGQEYAIWGNRSNAGMTIEFLMFIS